MATPNYPSKRFFAAGAKKGAVWGTAVALGAGFGILIENDGNPQLKQPYNPHDDIDAVMPFDGDLGPIAAVDFAPEFAERYDPGPLGSMIAALFGTCPAPTLGKSILDWADSMSVFFTFAAERPGTILEVASAMPMKYGVKVTGGLLKGSIGLRGNTVTAGSAVNTATVMDALTYVDRANRIKFSEGVLRMNAESGAALASPGDVLEVSDIDISYERALDDVHAASSESIILPREKGFKMIVKVTLPRTSAANLAYLATFKAMTAQKMDITFTGGIVADTTHYSRVYAFPRLKLSEPPVAPLADIMATVLTFEAEQSIITGGPLGMLTHYRPYIEMVNAATTGYLA